jgi:hypothetical protein
MDSSTKEVESGSGGCMCGLGGCAVAVMEHDASVYNYCSPLVLCCNGVTTGGCVVGHKVTT